MNICQKTILVSSVLFAQLAGYEFSAKPFPELSRNQMIGYEEVGEKKETQAPPVLSYVNRKKDDEKKEPVEEKKHSDEPCFSVSADLLVWKMHASDAAYTTVTSNSSFENLPYTGSVEEVNFNYDLGFRLGAAYNTQHDEWNLTGGYTYYRPAETVRRTVQNNAALQIPYGISQAMAIAITGDISIDKIFFKGATSSINLDYQMLELMLQRQYKVGKIGFTPKIGLEGGWLNWKQVSSYNGGTGAGNNLLITHNTNDYWGVGPKTGLSMAWDFMDGFSLLQEINLSLLLGVDKVRYREIYTPLASNQNSLKLTDNRLVPHLAGFMGIGYSTMTPGFFFSSFNAKLGFEAHMVFNYAEKFVRGIDPSFGYLWIYGATAGVGLGF